MARPRSLGLQSRTAGDKAPGYISRPPHVGRSGGSPETRVEHHCNWQTAPVQDRTAFVHRRTITGKSNGAIPAHTPSGCRIVSGK